MSLTEMQVLTTILVTGMVGLDICARFSESAHLKSTTKGSEITTKAFHQARGNSYLAENCKLDEPKYGTHKLLLSSLSIRAFWNLE